MNIIRKAYQALADWTAANWYQRNGYYRLAQMYGMGQSTDAGVNVNVERALACSTVNACTRVICDPIANMPLPVVRKVDFKTTFEPDSRLHRILNQRPNEFQTARQFRRLMLHWALNYGNAFARVERAANMGEPVLLTPIHPDNFVKKDIVAGEPVYTFNIDGKVEVLRNKQVFHLFADTDDGLTGVGAVHRAKEPIGRAIAMSAYGATYFGRGAMPTTLMQRTMPFGNGADRQRFKDDMDSVYRNGKESFHRFWVFESSTKGGADEWKITPIGSDPSKAALVDQERAIISDICRFYGVSPTLVQELSNAHYNNVEHLLLSHKTLTLATWMEAFEQECHRVLLTDAQRAAGWMVRHDPSGFLRGDFKSMLEAIAIGLEKGAMTINEGREMIDFDPIEGGNALYIQLNRQTVPGTGTPTTSEQATLAKLNAGDTANAQ